MTWWMLVLFAHPPSSPQRSASNNPTRNFSLRNTPYSFAMGKKMYGYIVNEDALLKQGLEMKLGTDESHQARRHTILTVVEKLMCQGGVYGRSKWVGVNIKGEYRACIALASSDPLDFLPVPPPEVIEKFKKVMNLEKNPQWYPY